MKAGNRITWNTLNGPREGTLEEPARWPGYWYVRMTTGRQALVHISSMKPKTN